MLSIQECISKTEDQRRKVEHFMDSNGYFDARECNIYEGLKRSVQRELRETLHKLSLKEVLYGSGGLTTGYPSASGSIYLVPTWLSQKLYAVCSHRDIVPIISMDVFEARGSDCTVPMGKLEAYTVGEGPTPTSSYTGSGATISLKKIIVPGAVTDELIEDNQFGIVEWLITQAATAMAREANNNALEVLWTASDGYGARYYSLTGDADETKYTGGATSDVLVAWGALGQKEYVGNTMVVTAEAWEHSISQTTSAGTMDAIAPVQVPPDNFDVKLATLNLDVIFDNSRILHDTADLPEATYTACYTIIFDRNHALVTARKNWLRVENYANPVEDLAGAVITGRQDSVTVADDAVAVLRET